MQTGTKKILEAVRNGSMSVEDALLALKTAPFADVGFAKIDLHREIRRGYPEVIYGQGKTTPQIAAILEATVRNGGGNILITRLSGEAAAEISKTFPIDYHPLSKTAFLGEIPAPDGIGTVLVACAGTSDLPVAEEAARTAEVFGNKVERLYDVGVAGLHRLLSAKEKIMTSSVIVAAAGMEGALPSVIAGLADCPVIALPTSVGYGASFGGLAALLGMLNSCSGGVCVVNIDNGFGAGFLAGMINHMGPRA